MADRVREAAGGRVDGVFDVVGRTPVEVLTGLVERPSQVVTIANFDAGDAGVVVTGGGSHSEPMPALAYVAELLGSGALRIEVRTFPFERAREAYEISATGHVRGKLVLVP